MRQKFNRYQECIPYLLSSIHTSFKNNFRTLYSLGIGLLAEISVLQGNPKKSIQLVESVFSQVSGTLHESAFLKTLGKSHLMMNQLEKSRGFFEKALNGFAKFEIFEKDAKECYYYLARIFHETNQISKRDGAAKQFMDRKSEHTNLLIPFFQADDEFFKTILETK